MTKYMYEVEHLKVAGSFIKHTISELPGANAHQNVRDLDTGIVINFAC